jgi:hypothetical protein
MKASFFSVLFSVLSLATIAQSTDDYYSPAKPKLQVKDRISTSVVLGTQVSFLNNSKTSAVSTFIAPALNYKISQKFTLNAGLIHYQVSPMTAVAISHNETLLNKDQRMHSGNLVFAGGTYQLNKKLSVNGAVMMDANSLNNRQNNYKAASLGMDYKISEHSSIGFKATVSQGSTDYDYNPSRGSYEYHPLTNNPFGNIIGGIGQWGTEELNRSIR